MYNDLTVFSQDDKNIFKYSKNLIYIFHTLLYNMHKRYKDYCDFFYKLLTIVLKMSV